MRTKCLCCGAVLIWIACLTPAVAQRNTQLSLRQLTAPAGYIFAGRVRSVQYIPATRSSPVATMRITFQVEQGLRGVRTGRTLTIRQWAGLWDAGTRYRVGDRLLLFLYPPSRLGLTSPVGGQQGRFALDHRGQALVGIERAALFREMRARGEVRNDRIRLRDFMRGIRRAQEE